MTEKRIQKEHKDRLFNFLFGRAENKAWTLELYNAVNGSHYQDPEEYQIKTFLETHRAEVYGMLLTEYDEAETMELFRKEGKEESLITSIRNLMNNMHWTAEQAMEALGVPADMQKIYRSKL